MALGRHTNRKWWQVFKRKEPTSKCQWCGHTKDLGEINGDEFDLKGTYFACLDVVACHRRFWENRP